MGDRFSKSVATLESAAGNAIAIVPSDSTALAQSTRAIYVGTAGNIAILPIGYTNEVPVAVTFVNVPAGAILPVRASKILATGTTASDIVGMY